LILYKAVFTLV